MWVGVVTSSVLLALAITGLDQWFFREVLGASEETIMPAHIAFWIGALLPFIGALQSYVRGILTAHHLTAARLYAVLTSMSCLVLALALGVRFQVPGAVMAPAALTIALTVELGALVFAWKRGISKIRAAEAVAAGGAA
jgi:O-antigen/teichoic acid export membrane protein